MTNGTGGGANIADDFKWYDRLPRAVREVLADGPTNASAVSAFALGKQMGLDAQELRDELEERFFQMRAELARQDYGREHPMARGDCRWSLNPQPRRKAIDTRMKRL